MPLPRFIAEINRRVFNKREIKKGKRPVITHVGRSSGKAYQTPLDAHPVDNGFIFILMYGSDSDWVKNVLAASSASLNYKGEHIELTSPRLIAEGGAWNLMPAPVDKPPGLLNVTEFLQMDRAE